MQVSSRLLEGRHLEERLERLGLLMSATCAGVLALSAMGAASGGASNGLSSIMVPIAVASETWMDAGAGRVVRAFPIVSERVAAAPQTVLEIGHDSDSIVASMVPGGSAIQDILATGDAMAARIAADDLLDLLGARVAAGEVTLADAAPLAQDLCVTRADTIWALGGAPRGAQGVFLKRTAAGASLGDWQWGVPASVTLAQAILESDWGRNAPGNNLFGMKGIGPAGSTVRRVVEYRHGRRTTRLDSFRAYPDEAGAMVDHARVLGSRERYARARLAGDDPRAFARALVGVYASDPLYAQKLERLILRLGLDRFDWRPGGGGDRAARTLDEGAASMSPWIQWRP
ncbi:MAG: hypothetical protein EXR69_00985 [Myxococcales bacterium]|nr:hypothetical protein [Myxococcales bacterium]